MIELASETDFVAKSEQFQTLAGDIVDALRVVAGDRRRRRCRAETLKDGKTVGESIDALAAVIGEKLELRRAVKLDGQVATYLHKKATDLPPQVGVLVQFDGGDVDAARGAAMQIAAMRAALPHPRRGPGRRRRDREARRREPRRARRASPRPRCPRSSRAASNGFFKDNVLLEQASVRETARRRSRPCSTRRA